MDAPVMPDNSTSANLVDQQSPSRDEAKVGF
jgi:hypothetical protein